MFRAIRNWWTGVCIIRRTGRVRRQMSRLEKKFDKEFAAANGRLEILVEELGLDADELRGEIESHQTLLKRSEEALETARSGLRVAEKTIESLVASNKLLTDRWDAESAIQTRRRHAASTEENVG